MTFIFEQDDQDIELSNNLSKLEKDKLINDPDFILLKKFNYSLAKMVERYPDGAPDNIIASAIGVEEEEVEGIYNGIIDKIKKYLKV